MAAGTKAKARLRLRLAAAGVISGLATSFVGSAAIVTPASATAPATPVGALLATLSDPNGARDDRFGDAVAVSGTTAIVGAYGANGDSGAAYIYVEGASGWRAKPTTTLSDPAATAGDHFGFSVAVSGTTAIVGAQGTNGDTGTAYVYVEGASGWPATPSGTLKDPGATVHDLFGWSVAVSGTTSTIGAIGTNGDTGAAYVYEEAASGWPATPTTTLLDPAATTDDWFGRSVSVSGTTVAVGAYGTGIGAGAAYIYRESASGWPATPTLALEDPAATADDWFGYSVAVSTATVVVSAYGSKIGTGVAYVYVGSASGWPAKPRHELANPYARVGDGVGGSLSVSGRTAVVGACGTNDQTGAAYFYARDVRWRPWPTAKIVNPKPTRDGCFGSSVALSGKAVVVGADGSSSQTGGSYIYEA